MTSREAFEEWLEQNKDFMLGTRKVSRGDCFFVWQASREAINANANRYLHIREHSYVEVVCESPRVSRWAPERLDALVDAEMAKGVNHG